MAGIRRICVFCGSRSGARPEYVAAAEQLGTTLARRGIGVVYGGGRVGLMGALADAALANGGEVVGVIPEVMAIKEVAHDGLTELHVVASMHARKHKMSELADAFIALPGGYGTFEETFEMITWSQLGIHAKPLGLLNVAGFYDGLLALVDHAVAEGFIPDDSRALIIAACDVEELVMRLDRVGGRRGGG